MKNKCISGKRTYTTYEMAVNALVAARTKYNYASGNGPLAVYKCDDCGFYHLTSKGQINAELQKGLQNGNIERQKEADRWLDKIRKGR